jgi:hypothetical protein
MMIRPGDRLWLAETVRLREEHWGPLEDADAVRVTRHLDLDLPGRVLERAARLGRRERLDETLVAWRRGASLALAILLVLAAASGVATALGALGDGTRPVNVVWALGALLGLHALTFLLWLASFALGSRQAGSDGGAGLGRAWLWMAGKIARGPDAALAPQAFLALCGRLGALRWWYGAIIHLVWLLALLAALAALLLALSTASYRFIWATTLLSPDAFVRFTAALAWLPAHLGFAAPDAALVRASDGAHALPAVAQSQWSVWLVGALLTYGVLPRLAAWLLSVAMLRRAMRRACVDMTLPGYAALRDRLQPPASAGPADEIPIATGPTIHAAGPGGPDSPGAAGALSPEQFAAARTAGATVLVGLELPDDLPWPPPDLPTAAVALANIDTREQRNRLLDDLARAPAPRLLLVLDARQSPDRGTLALIAELCAKAGEARVWLYGPSETASSGAQTRARLGLWHDRLTRAGMQETAIMADRDAALAWLEPVHG